MDIRTFINNYREAFGTRAPLPILFYYSDTAIGETGKIGGCFFKGLAEVREGTPLSLNGENIGCGGGRLYTGFAPMPEHVPAFVSQKERYKESPQSVIDYIQRLELRPAPRKYLNFVRIDRAEEFGAVEEMEGILFFATPDLLSGLVAWACYDNHAEDAVATPFGSGCSTVVSLAVRENRRGGQRTFLGLFDPSVRPHVGTNELGFVIPASRFRTMYATMRQSCLFGTHAWGKVRERIEW